MLGRELAAEEHAARRAEGHTEAAGEPLLAFEQVGRRGHIEPFDLSIQRGEVIGMAGLLGSGRTETAEVMFGIKRAHSGRVRDVEGTDGGKGADELHLRGPRDAIAAGFGFAPEDRKTDGIVAELSIRENIILALQARRGWMRPIPRAEQQRLANDYIARLDIRTSGAEKAIGELSGGNQQKVVLARWLAMNPRFLILDEPTRGIDVGAHAEILTLIRELTAKGMAVLVISSELDELIAVSDRVIVLRDRRQVATLVGEEIGLEPVVRAIASADTHTEEAPA